MEEFVHLFMIEDNPLDIHLISNLLNAESGFMIDETAGTLVSALEKIQSGNCSMDAILLDLNLPDSEGLDTFFKVYKVVPNIPIIILTTLSEEENSIKALQKGAQDYLIKSELNASLLKRALRYAIERKSAEQKLADARGLNQMILDASGSGILVFTIDGDFIFGNEIATELLDVNPEELSAKNLWTISCFKETGLVETANSVQLTKVNCRKDFKMKRNFKDPIWLECTFTILRDISRELLLILLNDVTDQRKASDALHWERYLLNSILENLPDSFYFKDLHGKIFLHSRSMAENLGLEETDLTGKADTDIFMQETALQFMQDDQMIMQSGKPIINREELVILKNGFQLWCLTTKLPLFGNNGEVIGTFGISRDITSRKKDEDDLLKLSRAVEYSSSSIVITDLKGNIEFVNPAFQKQTGYSIEEAMGKNPRMLQSGHTSGEVYKLLWDTISHNQQWKGVLINRKKNGEIYWESTSISPILDKSGALIQYMGINEDITEMVRMQDALQWEKYLLDSLLDNLPDSIYFKDEKSRIIRISKAGAIKRGSNIPEQVIGKTDFEFFDLEYARNSMEEEQGIIENGKALINQEEMEIYPDKPPTWSMTTKLPLRNKEGKIIGTFGISRDITEKKLSDIALIDNRNRYKSLFDDSPTPMWEEDFSDVKKAIDQIKEQGITDFFNYFNQNPHLIKELTSKIKVLDINKAVMKLHHAYKKEDILNDITIVFTDSTFRTMAYEFSMIASGERIFDLKQEVKALDQSKRHIIMRWSVAVGYEQSLSRVLISIIDLTDHMRVQEALRESEDQLKDAQRIAHIGSWVFYPDSMRITWTDEMFRIYGTDPMSEAPSYALHKQFIHQEDWVKLDYLNQHLDEIADMNELEIRLTDLSNQQKIVIWKSHIIRNEHGNIIKVVGTAQDVTTIKKVERELNLYRTYLEDMIRERTAELEDAKRKNELILDAVGDGIFGIDLQDKITFMNPAAAKMIGWEIGESLGQNHHSLLHYTNTEGTDYNLNNSRVGLTIVDQSSHHVMDEVFWKKDKTSFPVEYICSPIWENNKVVGAVVVFSDITERKNAEKAMEEAREAAEAATRAKSEFLANMSHEIRTPMNAILGFSDLLSIGVKEEKQLSQVLSIRSSARSLLTIINDILDLSKIEAGKLHFEFEPVELNHIIQEINGIFSQRLKEKGLDFIIVSENGDLPTILIDEIRLRQILLNIIGNAIKFTEQGYVKLTVQEIKVDESGQKIDLHILVEDTGIGIRKEQQDVIFEAFNQQVGQSTRKYGGTGLGLTITKRLVEMMGGSIHVDSEPGKGSTFEILFPGISISNIKVFNREEDTFDPSSILFEKATVLICDDNESDRRIFTDALDHFALNLLEAHDGKIAVDLAQKNKPQLILMDLKMKEMGGIEATRLLKSSEITKDIPVILITASATLSKVREDYNDLFNALLMKPVRLVDLIETIKKFLKHKMVEGHINENDWFSMDYVFSLEQKQRFPAIVEELESVFLPIYRVVMQNQQMDHIESFGKKLIDLGDNKENKLLVDFGKQICRFAGNFDIEKLLNLLKMFPNIIDKFK